MKFGLKEAGCESVNAQGRYDSHVKLSSENLKERIYLGDLFVDAAKIKMEITQTG
jgi:hypothetical protein